MAFDSNQSSSGDLSNEDLKALVNAMASNTGQGLSFGISGFGGGINLSALAAKLKESAQTIALQNEAKSMAGEQFGYDVGAAGLYGVPKAMPKGLALGKYGLPAIYGYITKGSEQAQQSLMSAYRQAYAQRAAGIAGSYGLQMDQLQSEMLGQGMSADVARRIAAGQRGSALQQLGEAQAGAAGEYYTSLAQLQKGTGTELAAAKQAEIEQMLAPHIAQISGQYAAKAGKAQGLGNMLGQLGSAAIIAGI